MTISTKNAERALKMVGLDQSGPIRADDKAERIVQAARLAEFLDRTDHLNQIDPAILPEINLKPLI